MEVWGVSLSGSVGTSTIGVWCARTRGQEEVGELAQAGVVGQAHQLRVLLPLSKQLQLGEGNIAEIR